MYCIFNSIYKSPLYLYKNHKIDYTSNSCYCKDTTKKQAGANQNLSEEDGYEHIRHTLVRLNGEYIRDTPKTAGSKRRIVLPAYILDLLKEHRRRQILERFAAGTVWKAPDAVFTNATGNYMIGANLNAKLKRVCKAAGLPEIHLHSLRHTHASLLINSNITAKVISDRLGHSTTKTTLDTYSHVFAESEAKAMQAIDMALFRKAETQEDKPQERPAKRA